MTLTNKILITGAVVVVLGLLAVTIVRGREAAERATVTTIDQSISVRVADNLFERKRGLSGYELSALDADGMLFVFSNQAVREFWMHRMNFDLDVVWIKDGKIVGLDTNVPAPAPGDEPARMSSAPISADMVLELPAGDAKKLGYQAGMILEIELP